MNQSVAAKLYKKLTGEELVNTAMIYRKTTSGDGAIAIGVQTQAVDLATALGTRSNASGTSSTAIGTGATSSYAGSVALGAGSKQIRLQLHLQEQLSVWSI